MAADERRYDEDEVREIFDLATRRPETVPAPTPGSSSGMSLAELQEIGREVGLDPESVAAAAAHVRERGELVPRRHLLGLPVSVGRVVELPRAPTDREWEMLVGECRRLFGARGRVSGHGSLREWSNSNLHVCVEPSASGYRLRMGTRKGSAMSLNAAGAISLSLAVVIAVVMVVTGGQWAELMGPAVLGAIGAMALGSNALTLPGWAREREEQMEILGERARELLGEPGPHANDD